MENLDATQRDSCAMAAAETKPFSHPLIPDEPDTINLQNLPESCKPRALPKGFDTATEMKKGGGGTLSQLKSELHIGAFTGDVTKVRQVLAAGKSTSNKYRANRIECDSPPLILAVRAKAKDAAADGRIAEIAQMLIDAGANVNYTMQGEECPLMLAATYAGGVGKVQAVRTLLNAGANVRQRDKRWKYTSLHWAVISGWSNVVEALIEGGGSCTSVGGKEKESVAELARNRLSKLKCGKMAQLTGPFVRAPHPHRR